MRKALKYHIDIDKSTDEIGIFDSKFGGVGYFKEGSGIPVDSSGDQLRLLAQLNFTDIRSKIELPSELDDKLPKSGLLQIWVSTDDVAGCSMGTLETQCLQKDFKVIYYKDEELTNWATKEQLKEAEVPTQYDEDELFPISGNKEYTLTYEIVDSENLDAILENDDEDAYNKAYPIEIGHKTGGYPYFVQSDPRYQLYATYKEIEESEVYDFLLLQIDSEWKDGKDLILWGDSGCAQFLISSKELKELNFSNVLYNWDCC